MASERQVDLSPRFELGLATREYKEWRAGGGSPGSEKGRKMRARLGGLVEQVKNEISWEETVACDVDGHAINPFEEDHGSQRAA